MKGIVCLLLGAFKRKYLRNPILDMAFLSDKRPKMAAKGGRSDFAEALGHACPQFLLFSDSSGQPGGTNLFSHPYFLAHS